MYQEISPMDKETFTYNLVKMKTKTKKKKENLKLFNN